MLLAGRLPLQSPCQPQGRGEPHSPPGSSMPTDGAARMDGAHTGGPGTAPVHTAPAGTSTGKGVRPGPAPAEGPRHPCCWPRPPPFIAPSIPLHSHRPGNCGRGRRLLTSLTGPLEVEFEAFKKRKMSLHPDNSQSEGLALCS
ncbi:splicing factor 3B subunit 4-like isoform X2 [Melopsittacus undulatus]|uniref:splicing factor 3B subunit 4-like isoform X2 n=1 Tax=Melopsittacus undulatus TaxID=13146 RepID=UPI00146E8C20|nr:splicing factor 3B subunit 4-like isoform X2 [Melopsittacus undulatus]